MKNELLKKDIEKNYKKLIAMNVVDNSEYFSVYRSIRDNIFELQKLESTEDINSYFNVIPSMTNFTITDFKCDHNDIVNLGKDSTIKYSKCLNCGKTWFY